MFSSRQNYLKFSFRVPKPSHSAAFIKTRTTLEESASMGRKMGKEQGTENLQVEQPSPEHLTPLKVSKSRFPSCVKLISFLQLPPAFSCQTHWGLVKVCSSSLQKPKFNSWKSDFAEALTSCGLSRGIPNEFSNPTHYGKQHEKEFCGKTFSLLLIFATFRLGTSEN